MESIRQLRMRFAPHPVAIMSHESVDLLLRAIEQLGEFFKAQDAVERAVLDFAPQNEAVAELVAARKAIDTDVLEFIDWEAE